MKHTHRNTHRFPFGALLFAGVHDEGQEPRLAVALLGLPLELLDGLLIHHPRQIAARVGVQKVKTGMRETKKTKEKPMIQDRDNFILISSQLEVRRKR